MLEVSRLRLILLMGFLLLAGCASQKPAEDISQSDLVWKLVWPEQLADSNLEIVWQYKLPMKALERLEQLYIFGDRIYALSNENYMVSLDRKSGQVMFSRSVGHADFEVVGMELYDDELISIIGSRLIQINSDSGVENKSSRMAFGVTCPAARNKSYFYIAGVDNRIRVLRADDKVKLFEVAANNDSRINSIAAGEKSVIFATEAGNVISILPDRPKLLWQFEDIDGSIIGPIVRDAEAVFFSGTSSNVYKLDASNGRLVWKYQTDALLDAAVVVSERIVYQNLSNKALVAIDKESGELIWRLDGGIGLL